MSIKLIVDSAGDIDKAEAENRNITLIPMEVSFGNETYFDGVNLSRREFSKACRKRRLSQNQPDKQIPLRGRVQKRRFGRKRRYMYGYVVKT